MANDRPEDLPGNEELSDSGGGHDLASLCGVGVCRTAAAAAIAILVASSGIEATAQQVPPTAEPSRIEKQFEAPPVPKAMEEPVVPETERPLPPAEAKKIRFTLTGLVVEGSTVYDDKDFLPFYEKHLGKEVSLALIYDVAAAISAEYRNEGYILSRAVVPAQRIRNGIVHLKIVEGFIHTVFIEGDILGPERLLKAYADKISQSRPLRSGTLERYLLLAGDLPGVTAKGVLTPSPEVTGASDLVVILSHAKADGFVSLDNRGSRFVGPHEIGIGTNLNSTFGFYERFGIRFIGATQTDELKLYEATFDEPLGTEGTKLSLTYSRTLSEPGFTLKPLNVDSTNTTVRAALSHPFIRSRGENLTLRANFTYRNSTTNVLSSKLSEDRIRSAGLEMTYDFVDRFRGVNLIDLKVSRGLDILNETTSGSADLTRALGKSDFTKVTTELSRLQRLSGNFTVLAVATGQWAADELLASEEFGAGGARFGRAYDASEITGDHGAAGLLELQYGQSIQHSFFQGFQLYGFYDYGATWRKTPGANEPRRQTLASAGFGLRYNLTRGISGYVEVAKPLTRSVSSRGNEGDDRRVFFSLAKRF